MSKFPSLLQQFRSFCYQNNPQNIESAIEYFAIFGGMGWKVDMSKPLETIIEEKVLENYRYIHGDITKITQSNKLHHSLLSAIATGDRREHSAFKKTKIHRVEGEESIDFLVQNNLLIREQPQAKPLDPTEEVSDKLLFTLPFMRFWFALVSPFYKGIKEGEYKEFKDSYNNAKAEFSKFIYERLVLELVKESFDKSDSIQKIGSYWDSDSMLDILAKTKSGKIIAGTWKFSKSKAKKSELTKIKETCTKIDLNTDIYLIFSKSGFSNELKNEKSETVKLFAMKNLNVLIKDLSEDDLIENTNKRY